MQTDPDGPSEEMPGGKAEGIWEKKLCSLLHDPPLKAYDIRNHKRLAKELADAIGIECDELSVTVSEADRMAAASDRIPLLTSEEGVDWSSGGQVLYHPLGNGSNLLSDQVEISRINDAVSMRRENLRNVSAELSARYKEIHSEIKEKLSKVGNRLNDPRRKFLWLWRNIELLHGEKRYRGFILSWLPADTRLPDHSIYDHLITASSFALGGEMTLVSVDIGGVQEFIKQSRKVRDLWASSYIISMLSTAGMMAVVERLGPDSIIHPDLRGAPLIDLYLFKEGVLTKKDLESLWGPKEEFKERFAGALLTPSIPGSFTFVAPSSEVDCLLKEIERRIKELFRDLLDFLRETLCLNFELRHDLPYPLSLRFYRVPILNLESENREFEGLGRGKDKIKEKLKKIIPEEIYETYKSDGVNLLDHLAELIALRNERKGYRLLGTLLYQVAYSVLQAGIASQKLTSDFKYAEEPSVEDGEPVRRRCKLCGVRNPIPKWKELVERLRNGEDTGWAGWLLDEDEPLCPFCLAKRLLRSFYKGRYESRSPLLKIWGSVIGCDENEMRGILEELKLLEDLSSIKIPTLDDIAAVPLKREIKRRLNESEVSERWNDVVSRMAQAVAAAVRIFCGSSRESDAKRHSLYIVSEVMRKFPMSVGCEEVEVLADFIAEKLSTEFKDPLEVPGTYYFSSVWENLLSSISGEERWSEEAKALSDLIKSLRELYEKLKMEPSNYVTYILSDGDRLGYWISGRMFFEKGITLKSRLHPSLKAAGQVAGVARFITPSLHRTISRIIRGLAQEVYPYIVSSLDGLVIYSGGDDLMAIVPASNTLRILEMLHSCYSAEVIRLPDGKILMSMGKLATLSSGAVIAHRLLPMSEMLEKLREEEEFAKKERDRCSLVRLTRGLSEERAVLTGKLLRVTEGFRMGEGAELVFQSIDNKELSNSFLRDLMEYLDLYSSVYSSIEDEDLLRGFIRRAVERNIHVPDEKRRKELRDRIMGFYENLMRMETGRLDPLMNFHRALLMISKEVV